MLTENYTATASQTVFNFTFDLIETAFVSVTIDDVLAADWSRTADKEITLGPSITLAGGEIVSIQRTTPIDDPLVEFTAPSSVRAREINIAVLQLLHRIQEQEADFSQSIKKNFLQTKWDATGLPLENVGDPTADQEAVTLAYLNQDLLDYLTNDGTEWDGQGFRISGLSAPADGDDAVTVDYMESTLLEYLTYSGSDWEGLGKRLSNIAAPQDDADAVTQGSLNSVLVDYLTNDGSRWDGKSLRIGDVAFPIDPNDVATKAYLDQVIIESGLIPVTDVTDAGRFLVVDDAGFWSVEEYLPIPVPADDGKLLSVDASGDYVLRDETVEIPTIGVGDAGKVLRAIGEVPGAYDWTDTGELPDSFVSDDGKALVVDAAGDPQWTVLADELPAVTAVDEDKVLTVDAAGDWVAAAAGGGGGTNVYVDHFANPGGIPFNSVGTNYINWNTKIEGNGVTDGANNTYTVVPALTGHYMLRVDHSIRVFNSNASAGTKNLKMRVFINGVEQTLDDQRHYWQNMVSGTTSANYEVLNLSWFCTSQTFTAGDTFQFRVNASDITLIANKGSNMCVTLTEVPNQILP